MKKTLITLLFLFASLQTWADIKPEWIATLESCDIIDSVVAVTDPDAAAEDMSIYHLYYHQPVCHSSADKDTFQLRCAMVVRNDNDPATCCNVMNIPGYNIDTYWEQSFRVYLAKSNEIAQRYHANLFVPEHRYFTPSEPDNCWQKLEWCTAEEASHDFHSLLEALKSVFKGKWAMNGISKGGICTAIQQAYHPEDAEIYISNCAPFCNTVSDQRLLEHVVSNGWETSTRNRYNNLTRELLEDSTAAGIFADMFKQDNPTASDFVCRHFYYNNAMEMSYYTHSYTPRDYIDAIMDNNDANRQYILEHTEGVTSSYLNALMVYYCDLDASYAWGQYLPESSEARKCPKKQNISISEDEWYMNSSNAYYYQAAHELGQYGFDVHYLFTEPEEQQFADSLQEFYDREGPEFYIELPYFKNVKYDDYALFSMIEQKTKEATKPIIFLYGEDDFWTGAAMRDEFINGDNVHKYILDAQAHGAIINMDTTSAHDEIWTLLDNVMDPGHDGIQNVSKIANRQSVHKYLDNGRFVIEKNGRKYNSIGIKTAE